MGKLYRRPNSPYWWARWTDYQGEHRRQSTRSGDRKVAALFLSAREAEVIHASAGYATAGRIALSRAFAEYLAERQPPIWSARWLDTVTRWGPRIMDTLGGPARIVAEIERQDAERARALWTAGTDLYRKVKPPTANRLTAIASGFWRWAIDRAYALDNPWAKLPKFAEERRTPPIPSEAELDAWLAAIPDPEIRRAAAVEVDTALRRSELLRTRLEDLKGDVLSVVSSYERGHTKTKEPRQVPLTPRALQALQKQAGARRSGPFFQTLPDYRKALDAAAEATGLRLRWHDLRHVALTRLANQGAPGVALRGIAGWRSGGMETRYIHPTLEVSRAAVARLAACATAGPKRKAQRGKDRHKRRTRNRETPANQ